MKKYIFIAILILVTIGILSLLFFSKKTNSEPTPVVQTQKTMFQAIETNDLEAVKQLIQKNPEELNLRDPINFSSPLLFSLFYETPEITNYLLEKGAEVNNKNGQGVYPITMAAAQGNTELVKKLLESGAQINVFEKDGKTALYYPVVFSDEAMVRLLIENGADVNAKLNDGTSILSAAYNAEDKNITDLLKRAGAKK